MIYDAIDDNKIDHHEYEKIKEYINDIDVKEIKLKFRRNALHNNNNNKDNNNGTTHTIPTDDSSE